MSKSIQLGLRVTAVTALVALVLALAACTNMPGLPAQGGATPPAAATGAAPKAAAPTAAAPKAAAPTAAAPAAGATAAPKAGATTAPAAGATAAPKAVAPTAAAPAAAAQAAPAGKTSQTLEGPVWKLQSYTNVQGQTAQALPNVEVTAEFKAGRVNGTAGCNTYFAGYKTEGNKLTISAAGSTMRACPELAVMAQEAQYLQLLGKSATYQITGDTLAISDANGKVILTFLATVAPNVTSNPWDVISYNNGKQAVVSVDPAAPMTAVFSVDGKVSGSSGCNTYSGGYQVDGNKIKIGQLATTQKMCAAPIMEQEKAYLKALQSSATWSFFNGILGMRTAQDAMSVNFIANEAAVAGLAGSNWEATGVNNGRGGVESLPAGVKVTAMFGTDGRVSGSSGCNTYNGPFTVDGQSIKIGPVMSTMMACEAPAMQTEQLYLKALSNAAKWSIDGGNLFLRDASGAIQATYAPMK